MARLYNRVLFFTTSPRTPAKTIPEIALLHNKFEGKPWNRTTQREYMDELAASDFFEGEGSPSDKAFSARDRINRAPKALGFVDLKPNIALTDAGRAFVFGNRPQEIFLRQLLKFQLPSPYHTESARTKGAFFVRPYLEILRLLRDLEYLTFDELKIFAVQLTDYRNYEAIRELIASFRRERRLRAGEYKRFVNEVWIDAILGIHNQRIAEGRTRTRETRDASLKTFILTQKRNMRDYADACFRYLRYTGLVSIAHNNKSISIFADKARDVDYILENVDRNPVYIDDMRRYKAHLFQADAPVLYADDRERLIDAVFRMGGHTRRDLKKLGIDELKNLRDAIYSRQSEIAVHEQIERAKSREAYAEIIDMFKGIAAREYYDAPLMLEYNTWRALLMLNGGNIVGNFKFDDAGQPLSTAPGNMPDIECDYGNYAMSVEVTMKVGQRQHEAEGESVARHYGQLIKRAGKDAYCLFVAPSINAATLAHFYGLNHIPIELYGGRTKIIPLALNQFTRLLEHSHNQAARPVPADIRRFLIAAVSACESAENENTWGVSLQACVDMWPGDP